MSTSPESPTPENIEIDPNILGALLLEVTARYEQLRTDAIGEPESISREEFLAAVLRNDSDEDVLSDYDRAEMAFDDDAKAMFVATVEENNLEILKDLRLGFIDEGDFSMSDLDEAGTHGSYLNHKQYTFTAPAGKLVIEKALLKKAVLVPERDLKPEDFQLAAAAISTLASVVEQLSPEDY